MIDEFYLDKHSALSVAISDCLHVRRKLMHLQSFAFHNGSVKKVKNAVDAITEACEEIDIELHRCEEEILEQVDTNEENNNET